VAELVRDLSGRFAPEADRAGSARRGVLSGIRMGGSGAVVVGEGHPRADELRALRLPQRPLLTTIVDHVAFEMDPAATVSR